MNASINSLKNRLPLTQTAAAIDLVGGMLWDCDPIRFDRLYSKIL